MANINTTVFVSLMHVRLLRVVLVYSFRSAQNHSEDSASVNNYDFGSK